MITDHDERRVRFHWMAIHYFLQAFVATVLVRTTWSAFGGIERASLWEIFGESTAVGLFGALLVCVARWAMGDLGVRLAGGASTGVFAGIVLGGLSGHLFGLRPAEPRFMLAVIAASALAGMGAAWATRGDQATADE